MLSKRSENLLTIQEAADLLNCHPNTLRQWEEKGVLKPIRIGVRKDRRYRRADLEKFLSSNTSESLEQTVLPSGYDLTRIDMTGTFYEGIVGDALASFKGYEGLERQTINKFDFKKFLKEYNQQIQDFPKLKWISSLR